MVRLFEIALNGFGAESSEILSFGTWGSYGNQKIHIAPDENWEGLVITAYFRLDNEPVGSCLFGEDMTIDIPPEATAKPTSGSVKGKVTFRGTQDGRVIITTDLPYFVLNHSDTEESDNKYTPDQWSQFVSQVDASRKAAEAASAQASESAEQAAQSLSDAKQVESNVIHQGSTAVQNIQSSLSAATASINAQTNQSLSAIQSKQDEAVAAISEQVGEAQKSASLAAQYASNAEASANAAAENASKVQQEVESGISAIGNATESAKSEIQTAKTAAVDAVNQTKTQAVSSVITQQSSSIQAVQAAQNTAVQAVQTAQTEGVKAVNDAGNAKIEQIEQINALVPTPTPEDAGKVVVVKPDGTGYELGDAGIKIDDTVVAPDTTWSSLNIVNKLCPPFSVTGDVVQFIPVEGCPLSVQSTIVATQEGTGDPSPTNVRPIVPVNEAGIWWIAGDNVLNLNHVELGTFSTVNGQPTESATQYRTAYKVPCTKNSVLYQSNNKNLNVRVFVWNESGGFVASEVVVSGGSYTFTVDGYFAIVSATSGFAADHYVGFSKTAVPYVGKDYTSPLPEPCYGGEIDLTDGKFSNAFGVTVVDGTTVKFTAVEAVGEDAFYNLTFHSSPNVDQHATDNILSSHFPYIVWDKNETYDFIFSTAKKMAPYFSNVDELNAYCQQQYTAGTPVTIAYPLSTAETVGIDPLTIPAPASPATAYSTSGEITVSGRSDPTVLIQQMQSRLAALESAQTGI